ncbi:MAG TPA: CinA family protein [Casimicrobiaceae bacterium]|nr:CinA family protein [Casimicrobiaceae bacterium]
MPLDFDTAEFRALAVQFGNALRRNGLRVATAESCTGGLIAGVITDVAGSSAWFERGFVTYSNDAKSELLGVSSDTIAAQGAVSEAVAREMAEGAIAHSHAECALSVTGIAGPDGGSTDKPVGTVCFGWLLPGGPPVTTTRHFPGDRAAVRGASVRAALDGFLQILDARVAPR